MNFVRIISKYFFLILIYLSTYSYLYAQSWMKVPEIDSTDVLSVVNHNNILFASTTSNIYRNSSGSNTWQPVTSLPSVTSDFNTLFSDESFLYLGTGNNGIFRSSSNGENWDSFSSGLSGMANRITCFAKLGDTLYTGTDGAGVYFINLQNPGSWSAVNDGLIHFGVTTIAASGDYIIVGSGLYLFVKSRNASQWQNVFVDSIEVQRHIFDLKPINGYLFAGTDNGIYRGSIDGQVWEKADISFFPGHDIIRVAQLGTQLLAALLYQNQHWIFSSSDNGTNWETRAHEFALLWDMISYDNRLWAGRTDGLWYYDTSTWTTVDQIPRTSISNYSLYQNYPNPFNPSTKIRYSILCVGAQCIVPVQLKVYDVLGNEVTTLVNEEKPAGSYEVEFGVHSDESQNLTSGVYFYTLRAGDYSSSRKMILLK